MSQCQVVAVARGSSAPIPRQSDDLAQARAIAWECYTYDQASGMPEADDYQVREDAAILYSADLNGQPAQVLCRQCHVRLVAEDGQMCATCL